jgi:hypothetical protein
MVVSYLVLFPLNLRSYHIPSAALHKNFYEETMKAEEDRKKLLLQLADNFEKIQVDYATTYLCICHQPPTR